MSKEVIERAFDKARQDRRDRIECGNCCWWSDQLSRSMVSSSGDHHQVTAMCLRPSSPNANRWMTEHERCDKHEPGAPVDIPEALTR